MHKEWSLNLAKRVPSWYQMMLPANPFKESVADQGIESSSGIASLGYISALLLPQYHATSPMFDPVFFY